jgi:hypothetical protein
MEARADRFIWDYWHVPGEYTLLRRPAHAFFPSRLYVAFHRHLVEWGRRTLGCHDISPPWLSCYVEGCRQEAHRDLPHGPLAFVYSLTKWKNRAFRGGETFITRPARLIAPDFNRLLVFNPSITHGVREIRGTHDPRKARLVINGWFVNPRPFWYGALEAADVRRALKQDIRLDSDLGRGFQSFQLEISPAGRVTHIKSLFSTLAGGRAPARRRLVQELAQLRFPRKAKATRLTLPLTIE